MSEPSSTLPEPPAGDPHTALALRAASVLTGRFPTAGIGVAGSVATGRHHPESDVDLLAVDPRFARDLQFAFPVEGIRVNVLAASPERLGARLESEAHRFASMLLGYVLGAHPVHDPQSSLAGLRARAGEIRARRESDPQGLLAHVLARIDALAADSDARPPAGALAALLLDAWFLRRGRLLLDKRDAVRPFVIIGEEDPGFSRLLSRLVAGEPGAGLLPVMLARLTGEIPDQS